MIIGINRWTKDKYREHLSYLSPRAHDQCYSVSLRNNIDALSPNVAHYVTQHTAIMNHMVVFLVVANRQL